MPTDARRWQTYVFIDTGVGEELQELELTEGAEAEESVLEGEDFLDSDLSVRGFVKGSNNGAVCAFAETVEELVIIACGKMSNRRQSGKPRDRTVGW